MKKNHIKKQPKDMKQRELVKLRREKKAIVGKVLDLLHAYEIDRGTSNAELQLRKLLVRWGVIESVFGELPSLETRPKPFTAAEISEQEAILGDITAEEELLAGVEDLVSRYTTRKPLFSMR